MRPTSPSLPDDRCPSERGQATVVLLAVLVVSVVLAVALLRQAAVVVDAARAQTAADAAALAGAADGVEAARRLARENGATVTDVRVTGDEAVVRVRVGRAWATARARRDGTWCRAGISPGVAISYTEPPCPSSPG